MAQMETMLPERFLDPETQAVILAGLCCVGAWVIFKWIIQMVFSVLWPLFVISGVMIFVPAFRKAIAYDIMPKQIIALKCLTRRVVDTFNSTYPVK